ncbi:hypothetical protein [Nonomuraea typhae]|uniref:hypothetical protein n=1 Tax=Nonomuraea typhae TaxID=2603600 RepID=UPI0012F9BEE1|nr:hypothetical protein [Nonomuraea typhae]
MLSTRRAAATAAAVGVLALVVLLLTGVFTLAAAAVAAALLVSLAALAFLVLTMRRLDGKAQRIDLRVKKNETSHAANAATLKRIETRLEELSRAVEESAARRTEDLSAILVSLGEDRVNAMAHAREVERLREEVRALGSA